MTFARHFSAVLPLALATLLPVCAQAGPAANLPDMVCAPRDEMHRKLRVQFGAEPQGSGLHGPDEMLEIWSSARTGDWTLVRSYARGISCIVAMGDDWAPAPPRDPA